LLVSPPALLRVGSGYAAKIVCSNVFLAGRDADAVLASDVQAPGNPLLRLMRVSAERSSGRVHAGLLGFIAGNDAVYRPGHGCAVTSDPEHLVAAPRTAAADVGVPAPSGPWPEGEEAESDQAIAGILSDPALTGPGMRAVLVVKNGRLIGERYGDGFTKDMPLIGWSMTKTVNAALIGRVMGEGHLALTDKDLLPEWSADARRDITLAQLLAMESGLAFDEDYGTVADVTRMLYLEDDMAHFAASRPLEAAPGSRFHYSSGTAVLLSRIWMNRIGDEARAQAYPQQALFRPLGMHSAVLEADAAGTFAGSSYLYATAHDWARFGLLLADDGVWHGQRLLPAGFVDLMQLPNAHGGGRYSQMQTWLPVAGTSPVPAGTFMMQGHDGQTIAIDRSRRLVVLRMGLTPFAERYDVAPLIAAVASATDR
jgi:CubicO group peptidase (beta-lactamase class C family)